MKIYENTDAVHISVI